jgi:chemotaxis protein MotB
VVAREFSPGKPDNTAINSVRQFTIDSNRNTLDALNRELDETKEHARRLREALRLEIARGDVAIQTEGMKIVIHITENASFDSGLADIRRGFVPVLAKIATLLDNNSGAVTISGHTDNVPIANDRFRSNWDLSTSRAVSVAHELLKASKIDSKNLTVSGHAETRPRAPNDTAKNRARNRRVDISIVRGQDIDQKRILGIATAARAVIGSEGIQP